MNKLSQLILVVAISLIASSVFAQDTVKVNDTVVECNTNTVIDLITIENSNNYIRLYTDYLEQSVKLKLRKPKIYLEKEIDSIKFKILSTNDYRFDLPVAAYFTTYNNDKKAFIVTNIKEQGIESINITLFGDFTNELTSLYFLEPIQRRFFYKKVYWKIDSCSSKIVQSLKKTILKFNCKMKYSGSVASNLLKFENNGRGKVNYLFIEAQLEFDSTNYFYK